MDQINELVNFKKMNKKLVFKKIEIDNLNFSINWVEKPKLEIVKENFLILLKNEEKYCLEKQIISSCSFNVTSIKNIKEIKCKHCLQVAKYVAFNFCKKCYNNKKNNFIKQKKNMIIPFDWFL